MGLPSREPESSRESAMNEQEQLDDAAKKLKRSLTQNRSLSIVLVATCDLHGCRGQIWKEIDWENA